MFAFSFSQLNVLPPESHMKSRATVVSRGENFPRGSLFDLLTTNMTSLGCI